MTKRAAKRPAAKPRAKKARTTDPVLATLANAIFRECQKQSLNSRSSSLEADVAVEDAKLENLEVKHVELVKMATAEETKLASLQDAATVQAAKSNLADVTAVVNFSWNMLRSRRVAQQTSQTDLAHAEVEKITLESACKEFSFTPVTLDSNGLPQGMTLSLERGEDIAAGLSIDSWLRGFPDPGISRHKSFVKCLEQAISSDASALGDAVIAETLVLCECDSAVKVAEEEYETSKAAQQRAAADLQAAEQEVGDREAAVSSARQAVAECELEMEAVGKSLSKVRMTLQAFQDGPLAKFMACEAVHAAAALQAHEVIQAGGA